MGMNWISIGEQLRAIGVTVSGAPAAPQDVSKPNELASAHDVDLDEAFNAAARTADDDVVARVLKDAKAAGLNFFERATDGELIIDGVLLGLITPELRQKIEEKRPLILSALLPAGPAPSAALLKKLGVVLVYIEDEQTASEAVARLCAATPLLGVDVETAPRPEFLPVMWPISITNDGLRSRVQTVMDTSAALAPYRAEVRLLQVAGDVAGRTVALVIDLRRVPLASPALAPIWRHKLVGHNLSFDIKMLMANGIEVADDKLLDTILMSGLVLRGCADKHREGSRRCSLAEAVREALKLELPKASQLSPWWRDQLSEEQIAYAALDAVMSLRLAGALQPRIDNLSSGAQALSRLRNAVVPVARMELAGITLDRDGLAQQVQRWERELSTLKIEIAAIGVGNPGSAPQVGAWLRLELQRLDGTTGSSWLATWPRTETGALSTKAKHLRRLVGHVPSADLLVRYSGLSQLKSNFGDKLLGQVSGHTGRLHGNFLIAKAKSGRFSSSKPNLQNIPKSDAMRSVFVAGPGKALVVADYSQLELRVMAEIANDEVMKGAYRRGLDLHAVTGAGMLGIRIEEFDVANPVHKQARQKAKAVNFGVIFGSGPNGLREFARDAYRLEMTVDEARAVIDGFLRTYPAVASWQQRQAERGKRNNAVSTLGGRVYRFSWEPGQKYARNLALNLPVQGTAAEIAVEATIRISNRLHKELPGQAQLVLQVHDEFVVEADNRDEVVSVVQIVLEQEMTTAFTSLLPGAPTTGLVHAHAGPNWAAAKG